MAKGGAGSGAPAPSRDAVSVVARFRPLNKIELSRGGKCSTTLTDEMVTLTTTDGGVHTFGFDKVFGTTSTQDQVFEYVGKPILGNLFSGYNCSLFCYGQTGSGKTHTMTGVIEDDGLKGVIPRCIEEIFRHANSLEATWEVGISVSYAEVYMEKIRDLLDPRNDNLAVGEDPVAGVYIKGISEFFVTSREDVLDLMAKGSDNRATAATGMNAGSSRSHSLFILSLSQTNSATGEAVKGKLYLIDLAGSETVSKTGVSGQQLEELKKINKSLSALGNVINALTDGKSQHIPYRDSKLTRSALVRTVPGSKRSYASPACASVCCHRLDNRRFRITARTYRALRARASSDAVLENSLGGNSKTALIINCSPASYNENETLSTLRFGKRAKRIVNRAVVNRERSPEELKMAIAALEGGLLACVRALHGWQAAADSGAIAPTPAGDAASFSLPALLTESGGAVAEAMALLAKSERGATAVEALRAITLPAAASAGGAGAGAGAGAGGRASVVGLASARKAALEAVAADGEAEEDGAAGAAGAASAARAGEDAAGSGAASAAAGAAGDGSFAAAATGAAAAAASSAGVSPAPSPPIPDVDADADAEAAAAAWEEERSLLVAEKEAVVGLLAEAGGEISLLRERAMEAEARVSELTDLLGEAQAALAAQHARPLATVSEGGDEAGTGAGAGAAPSAASAAAAEAAAAEAAEELVEAREEADRVRDLLVEAQGEISDLRARHADLEARLAAAEAALAEAQATSGVTGEAATASTSAAGSSAGSGSGSGSGAGSSPHGCVTVYDVVWEHQRLYPLSGWSADMLPAAGPGSNRADVDPPAWARAAPLPADEGSASAVSQELSSLLHAVDAGSVSASAPLPLAPPFMQGGVSRVALPAGGREALPLPSRQWFWSGEWTADSGAGGATSPERAAAAALAAEAPLTALYRRAAAVPVPGPSGASVPVSLGIGPGATASRERDRDGEGWQYARSWADFGTAAAAAMPVALSADAAAAAGMHVRRRRWLRARTHVDVRDAAAARTHVAALAGRLEAQQELLTQLTSQLAARTDTIADYEHRLVALTEAMAKAAATGDLRYIGQGSAPLLMGAGAVGERGARILAGPSAAGGAGRATIRGGGGMGMGGTGAGAGGGVASPPGSAPRARLSSAGQLAGAGAGAGAGASPRLVGDGSSGGPDGEGSFGIVSGIRSIMKRWSSAAAGQPGGAGSPAKTGGAGGGAGSAAHPSEHAGVAALFDACDKGDVAGIEAALRGAGPGGAAISVCVEDRAQRTPLMFAARAGSLPAVQLLLKAGADASATDRDNRSALAYASRRGHAAVVQLLLDRGLNPNSCDVHGLRPLHQAVLGRSAEVAKLLLARSAEVNAADANGCTPLDLALRFATDGSPSPLVAMLTAAGGLQSKTAAAAGTPGAAAAPTAAASAAAGGAGKGNA